MATPYSQLPYGFRRGEGNYQYQEFLKRRMEEERQADFAARIAEERERISLSQWQPEPEQQEVKITTKADGTSTIVSTDKFPAQSLLDDPMGLEGTGTGDWGLSVTSDQAELDELRRINDLYAMGGQGDVGEVWAIPPVAAEDPLGLGRPQNQWDQVPADIAAEQDRIAYERQFTPTQPGHPLHQYWDGEKFVSTLEEEPVISPEGTPIAGFDMGGLQRFEPHIIPDEAYRQAYGALGGDQVRSMEMRGLLEDEARRAAIPPPPVQTIQPSPMVSRALAEVDRGTNNILPPLDVPSGANILPTMEEIPPTLPNWLTGMGEAEAPFVAPQAITPEQGSLGPPGTYSAPPWDRMGLLTDEEILAGGLPPVEGAYDPRDSDPMAGGVPEVSDYNPFADIEPEAPPLTSEDIFGGVSPEVPLDPVDPGLRLRGRVETDILESQAEGWIDPDTGKPFRGEMYAPLPKGAMRDTSRDAFNKLIQKVSAKTGISEEDVDTDMILDPNLAKVAESVDTLYQMQKQTAMMALVEGMKKKSKARSLRGVGRRRQRRQMQLLNPTPLQMEA